MPALMWNTGLWKSYDKYHSGLPIKIQNSGRESITMSYYQHLSLFPSLKLLYHIIYHIVYNILWHIIIILNYIFKNHTTLDTIHTSVTLVLRRPRMENHEFKVSLGCVGCSETLTQN